MRDDDDTETDIEPSLTTAQADEVIALVRTAFSGRVTPEAPVDGNLNELIEHALEHTLGDHVLWLQGIMIGVSLCPSCGAVSLYFLTPDHDFLHGALEVVESLRSLDGTGGDLDEMACTYRRTKVIEDEDHEVYIYTFGATYWLNFDDTEDKVIHATRALVVILDGVLTILTSAAKRTAEMYYRRAQGEQN